MVRSYTFIQNVAMHVALRRRVNTTHVSIRVQLEYVVGSTVMVKKTRDIPEPDCSRQKAYTQRNQKALARRGRALICDTEDKGARRF